MRTNRKRTNRKRTNRKGAKRVKRTNRTKRTNRKRTKGTKKRSKSNNDLQKFKKLEKKLEKLFMNNASNREIDKTSKQLADLQKKMIKANKKIMKGGMDDVSDLSPDELLHDELRQAGREDEKRRHFAEQLQYDLKQAKVDQGKLKAVPITPKVKVAARGQVENYYNRFFNDLYNFGTWKDLVYQYILNNGYFEKAKEKRGKLNFLIDPTKYGFATHGPDESKVINNANSPSRLFATNAKFDDRADMEYEVKKKIFPKVIEEKKAAAEAEEVKAKHALLRAEKAVVPSATVCEELREEAAAFAVAANDLLRAHARMIPERKRFEQAQEERKAQAERKAQEEAARESGAGEGGA